MKCPHCKKENVGLNLQETYLNAILLSGSDVKSVEAVAVCCGECDSIITVLPKKCLK